MCETPFHMLEFAFDFLQFSKSWAGGRIPQQQHESKCHVSHIIYLLTLVFISCTDLFSFVLFSHNNLHQVWVGFLCVFLVVVVCLIAWFFVWFGGF